MSKIAIYARVSTRAQQTDRQVYDLTEYAITKGYEIIEIFQDTGTGANTDRQGITDLLAMARDGTFTKVLVTEISRLGRKTSEVLQIVEKLTDTGVSIYVHNYRIETLGPDGKKNPVAQILFTLLAEFARLERENTIERIHSGLDRARRKGKRLGRPTGSKEDAGKILAKYPGVVRKLREGLSVRDTARVCGVSVGTVQKVRALI